MEACEQAVEMAIRKTAGRMQIKQIITGTAINVKKSVCDVAREHAPTLLDVRLNAIDDDLQSFVTVYPKDGSKVIVGIIENMRTEAVVLRCSEVEKVILKIGDQTAEIDKNGFVLNSGNLGGMVKVEAMVDWMSKLHSDLQTLRTQLSTHPTAGNGAPLGIVFNPSTPSPQVGTFANENVKQ